MARSSGQNARASSSTQPAGVAKSPLRLAETQVRPPQVQVEEHPSPLLSSGRTSDPPQSLRFIPERLIAVGGMGELRRYRDAVLGRDVVVKGIRRDQQMNETARQRFQREARIQASLQHPCIVPLYDIGNIDRNDVYFTMAHVSGRTLHQVLAGLREGDPKAERQFSPRVLLEAFCRVCLAVAFAHEHDVVHRDLKPENVMLGDYGEVYILDWGVARQDERSGRKPSGVEPREARGLASLPSLAHDDDDDAEEAGERELTAFGSTLGTLQYMAPEQYLASSRPDERGDVYSLGAILYEILSRRWFRDATNQADLVRLLWRESSKALDRPAPPGVSAELDAIWRKATAVRPDERFRSARELHDAIVGHLEAEREHEHVREVALEMLESSLLVRPVEAAPPAGASTPTVASVFGLSIVISAGWLVFLIADHAFGGLLGSAPMASAGAIWLTAGLLLIIALANTPALSAFGKLVSKAVGRSSVPPAEGPSGRRRVLVVDDDPMMLMIMTSALSPSMEVVGCASGEAALRALREQSFHVVCADYQMPGMDGLEVLKHVAQARPHAGCVLVTGSSEYARSEQRKGYYVLRKPFDPARLLSLVEQIARISEVKRTLDTGLRGGAK